MKRLVVVAALLLAGCIGRPPPRAPGMLGAPPSQKQVDACESLRTQHNVWALLGTLFGTAAGAGGSAAGFVQGDKTAQIGIGLASAGSGLFGAVAGVIAGFEADAYATKDCNSILRAAP